MRACFVIAFLLICACTDGSLSPTDLSGQWGRSSTVVGSAFGFSLTQVGDSLYGTGGYSLEAGPSGKLAVRGLYTRPSVQLIFTFDTDRRLFFTGQAVTLHMFGTVTDSMGSSSAETYDRR